MRFNLLKAFFNPILLVDTFFILRGGSGGGGSQTSTSYSTNLPEYARPYYQELLKQTGKNVFTTDDRGFVTGVRGQTELPQQTRVGFNEAQRAGMAGIGNLETPGQFGQSTAGLTAGQGMGFGAAARGFGQAFNYNPQNVNAQNIRGPQLTNFQMRGPQNVNAPNLQNFGMGTAQSTFNPNLQTFQMQNVQDVNAPNLDIYGMSAASTGYRPDLQNFQMAGPQNVGSEVFGQDAADFYMNPYQQKVTDIALREARQQADLQKQAGAMGAIGRGTFGGARQALMQAEGDRNTMRTLSDIQAQGSQQGFQNAQQQFQADQARRMQADLANQQAGMNTGIQNLQASLQTQQLGAGIGKDVTLANLSNEQQANVQNLAAKLQTQGLSAEQAMRAALSNQQAGLTVGQQNLASQQATQQLGAGIGKDVNLANLASAQQANVQNLAAQLQTQGLSAEQAMRAALANQQAGLTTGQTNLQAALGVQQLGAGQSLEAQKANQAAGLQAAQLNQQGQQFAAGLGKDVGLAGLSAGLESSKALGALGTEQQQADLARLQAKVAAGDKQQAQLQGESDTDYQNRMAALNYEKQQLEFYSNVLRGNAGALGSTQVQYAPAPSIASQVGGLGLAGLGLSKALG